MRQNKGNRSTYIHVHTYHVVGVGSLASRIGRCKRQNGHAVCQFSLRTRNTQQVEYILRPLPRHGHLK